MLGLYPKGKLDLEGKPNYLVDKGAGQGFKMQGLS